ncbi:unnamed protein product (macronuclear) [Paramecium tetraurelia]|uniref:Protein kinase domain-containing protein n=1 Tax=Paramecium tetraurelia TaxID=5888 RepID=A0BDQ3_PARTE|nr:uncharacterized protein GSPATT00027700001 [Paramecium tetraurelia]CAK56670.1 unnamed protein product [Paramecium tetraurelia]|eukprot:XP_001424068.1 hypothetical protein (macronuclear) [Paramecium tetraurelia strain d4-2]
MQTRIQQLSQLQPDKRILNYTFSQQAVIGRGSYGIVYVGMNIDTNQVVAIKVVPLQCDQQSLRKEIDIMKDLDCPNIVKLLDVVQTPNNCYIVSELCTGGDLREYMKRHGCLTEQQALPIITQILKGILQSFKRGIVHRDLKPANILITAENIFKIADFGFAKRFQHLEGDLMSSLAGTPLYMSPQVLLRKQYTSKCDVWSVGLIYYELIEGRTPWNVMDILDLINKQRNTSIKFSKKISPLSQQFILGCLQYEEQKRLGWEQVFTHPLFDNKFVMKELDQKSQRSQHSTSQIKNESDSSNINAKLVAVNSPPQTKSPLQIYNRQKTSQKELLSKVDSPKQEIRQLFHHSKTMMIPQTLKKDRTISIGNQPQSTRNSGNKMFGENQKGFSRQRSENDELQNNKQIIQNQIEFLLLMKQLRIQLLDYSQVTIQQTTVYKLQFIILKNIMMKTTQLKHGLIDGNVNNFELKDFEIFKQSDTFKNIEKQILELHFDSFNSFQECQLLLNENYTLIMNDLEFMDIFNNNFEYSIQFCNLAKHLSLQFIKCNEFDYIQNIYIKQFWDMKILRFNCSHFCCATMRSSLESTLRMWNNCYRERMYKLY